VSIEKPIKQDNPLHFAAAKGAVAVWRVCSVGFDCWLPHRGEIRFEAGYKPRNHGAPLRSAGYLAGLGQVLTALALLLQIAVPSLHRSARSSVTPRAPYLLILFDVFGC
jgi:hypothetical protein